MTPFTLCWLALTALMVLGLFAYFRLNRKCENNYNTLHGLRARVIEWEDSVKVNTTAITALSTKTDATEGKLTKIMNELIDKGIIIDWNKLTDADAKKLVQSIQEPKLNLEPIGDLVGKCKAEMDPLPHQFKQSIDHRRVKALTGTQELATKYPHYYMHVEGLNYIDVYRVLQGFNVTDPMIQHAIKKLMAAGNRGYKNFRKDLSEVQDTINRRIQILDEDGME